MQFVVSSGEMVELPQRSQVPDVVDVIVADVQDAERTLDTDFKEKRTQIVFILV